MYKIRSSGSNAKKNSENLHYLEYDLTDNKEPLKLKDSHLIQKMKDGDKKAFDLIVSKYQIRIYKIILKYIDNGSEALDVMQEAFLKAYQAMEFFRGESSLYTWLYRIAVNTAKNYTISNSKNSKTQSLDDEMDFSIKKSNPKDSASPENLLARDELEKILFEAIETLPQELKTAILLRELGGKSYEDISVIMDCPVGTVRSRIFRARETIEQGISPFLNLQ